MKRRRPRTPENVAARAAILAYLREHPGAIQAELTQAFNVNKSSMGAWLLDMTLIGEVERQLYTMRLRDSCGRLVTRTTYGYWATRDTPKSEDEITNSISIARWQREKAKPTPAPLARGVFRNDKQDRKPIQNPDAIGSRGVTYSSSSLGDVT